MTLELGLIGEGVGGVAWAVSVGDDVVYGSNGWLDPTERTTPMPADGIFRIASVSKPIVAVAALQMVEQGLFGLDDAIDDVLPELAERRVMTDPTGPLDQDTVPARRSLTLRDLLTFRCGLGMDFDFDRPQPVLERMWELGVGPGPTGPDHSPDRFMELIASLPLADQPGTRWRYHTGSDIVSVLIERVRGETLDVVLSRDVFEPVGMVDTGFWVGPAKWDRFGECRTADDDGELATWDRAEGRWSQPPTFRSGAAGLVSTTADLVAFGQMLLSGGSGPGGPVLAPESVAQMTTDQLDDDQRRAVNDDGSDALGWGFGVGVRHRADGAWPPEGSYGWDGGLGSRWLVDPERDVCAVILLTDSYDSPDAGPAMDGFVDALRRALA